MVVAVCDNLNETLDEMKQLLEQFAYIRSIELFSRIEYFFEEVNTGKSYDVVLMGIDWDDTKNGIDYAEEIYKCNPYTKVIFMTSYTMRYVEDAILNSSNMSGFLVKPVKEELLVKTLEKIKRNNSNTEGKLVVRYRGSTSLIPMGDIVYMESQLHKVNIVLDNVSYQCNERLSQINERLDERFLICHKSYIVNVKRIQSFKYNEILLDTGVVIPVSKNRYGAVKEFLQHCFE